MLNKYENVGIQLEQIKHLSQLLEDFFFNNMGNKVNVNKIKSEIVKNSSLSTVLVEKINDTIELLKKIELEVENERWNLRKY